MCLDAVKVDFHVSANDKKEQGHRLLTFSKRKSVVFYI